MVASGNESDHLKPAREYYVILVSEMPHKLRYNLIEGLLFPTHSKFNLDTFGPCPMLLDFKHLLEPNQFCIFFQHIFLLSAMFQAVYPYI